MPPAGFTSGIATILRLVCPVAPVAYTGWSLRGSSADMHDALLIAGRRWGDCCMLSSMLTSNGGASGALAAFEHASETLGSASTPTAPVSAALTPSPIPANAEPTPPPAAAALTLSRRPANAEGVKDRTAMGPWDHVVMDPAVGAELVWPTSDGVLALRQQPLRSLGAGRWCDWCDWCEWCAQRSSCAALAAAIAASVAAFLSGTSRGNNRGCELTPRVAADEPVAPRGESDVCAPRWPLSLLWAEV